MTWTVGFADSALRGLDQLPMKVAQAVVEFVTMTLPDNPLLMSTLLQRQFAGLRSARRGECRMLVSLDETTETKDQQMPVEAAERATRTCGGRVGRAESRLAVAHVTASGRES